jgi:CheY-like chemotaxis protein
MKGLETLQMFQKKQTPLDCAIVDIRLPDIDGLKLLKVIKVNYPNLPVIIITGHGDPAIEEAARSQNADGYLEKPFTVEELTQLLAEIPAPAAKAELAVAEAVAPAVVSAYALLTADANPMFIRSSISRERALLRRHQGPRPDSPPASRFFRR